MQLFIDLETLPGMTAAAREQARADTGPPGTYKKPESIATWWETEGPAAVDATWRKQALNPAQGEVCAIGFATEDAAPVSIVRATVETEADFLRRALGEVRKLLAREAQPMTASDGTPWPFLETPFVVCHHAAFDLPFLRARCWANRVPLPSWLPLPDTRQGKDYGDTMLLFAGHGGRISLDRLCRCLGVSSPKADGTTGADVLDLWQAVAHDRLAQYNAADVQACRACWRIMTARSDYPAEVSA